LLLEKLFEVLICAQFLSRANGKWPCCKKLFDVMIDGQANTHAEFLRGERQSKNHGLITTHPLLMHLSYYCLCLIATTTPIS
jgi:hypothetical protein